MTVGQFIEKIPDKFANKKDRKSLRTKCKKLLREDIFEGGNDMWFAQELDISLVKLEEIVKSKT